MDAWTVGFRRDPNRRFVGVAFVRVVNTEHSTVNTEERPTGPTELGSDLRGEA
jgi:hypothetical protein